MEAWIKYKGAHTDNYCRFGKEIPKVEVKIDICRFFGVNPERAKYIASKLLSDSRVECKIHKSASDSVRKEQVELEKKIEVKEQIKEEVKEVKKRKPRVKKEVE